jgi:hypothetical protein
MPKSPADLFPNHRWRKLHAILDDKRYHRYRRNLAELHARQWNATHLLHEQIVEMKLYRVFERGGATNEAEPGSKLFETIAVQP